MRRRAAVAVSRFAELSGVGHLDTVLMAGTGADAAAFEAAQMQQRWPGVKLIGWEPMQRNRQAALAAGFPGEIHAVALGRQAGLRTMVSNYQPDQRASFHALHGFAAYEQPPEITHLVETTTLASELQRLGATGETLLWLDAEGAEQEIVEGAGYALNPQRVAWLNVEIVFVHGRAGATRPEELIPLLWERGYGLCGLHSCDSGRQADAVFCCRNTLQLLEQAAARAGAAKKLSTRRALRQRRRQASRAEAI